MTSIRQRLQRLETHAEALAPRLSAIVVDAWPPGETADAEAPTVEGRARAMRAFIDQRVAWWG